MELPNAAGYPSSGIFENIYALLRMVFNPLPME
jgi:hypothetical protein